MIGKILKFVGHYYSPYISQDFFELWQKDTVSALSKQFTDMSDGSSCPAQCINQLVELGYLDILEVEITILGWLQMSKYSTPDENKCLLQILYLSCDGKYKRVSSFVAHNFVRLYIIINNGPGKLALIFSALNAPDISKELWLSIIKYLVPKYYFLHNLFKLAFIESSHSTAFDRELYLQRIVKIIRFQRCSGKDDEFLFCIMSVLKHNLILSFARRSNYDYVRDYELVEKRVNKWLASQNVYMPAF